MNIGKTLCATLPAFALAFTMSANGTAQAATRNASEAKTTHMKLPGYKTLSAARAGCGADTVVWHATGSKVFHGAGSKYFGKTKHGAYVCEKVAMTDHLRDSKY